MLLHVAVRFFRHHAVKRMSRPIVYSYALCCRLIDHKCIRLFLDSVLFHWTEPYGSVFVSVPYCFDYCEFIIWYKFREHDTSSSVLLKIALAIWDLLCFHTNFRNIYSISVEIAVSILIKITLNLWLLWVAWSF